MVEVGGGVGPLEKVKGFFFEGLVMGVIELSSSIKQ